MVFDTPVGGVHLRRARLERLAGAGAALARARSRSRPQWRVADRVELERALARTVAAGGEGLMLHVADAPVAARTQRSAAEVEAAPRRRGGRRRSPRRAPASTAALVGALEVESAADGRRFFIGSGLSDAMRREPPALGTTITYRYRELTSSGLPRFATYLRPHDDA